MPQSETAFDLCPSNVEDPGQPRALELHPMLMHWRAFVSAKE